MPWSGRAKSCDEPFVMIPSFEFPSTFRSDSVLGTPLPFSQSDADSGRRLDTAFETLASSPSLCLSSGPPRPPLTSYSFAPFSLPYYYYYLLTFLIPSGAILENAFWASEGAGGVGVRVRPIPFCQRFLGTSRNVSAVSQPVCLLKSVQFVQICLR